MMPRKEYDVKKLFLINASKLPIYVPTYVFFGRNLINLKIEKIPTAIEMIRPTKNTIPR